MTELTPDTDFKVGRDRLFIGFELIGVTNPSMVIIIEKLWATRTPQRDAPNPLRLLERTGECATVHPDIGDMPSPNAAEEGEHPHLAFEVAADLFQSK